MIQHLHHSGISRNNYWLVEFGLCQYIAYGNICDIKKAMIIILTLSPKMEEIIPLLMSYAIIGITILTICLMNNPVNIKNLTTTLPIVLTEI